MSELKDVLVIVDMQNDFITGALANKDAEAIVDPIAEKLKEYLLNEKDVFFTMDTHNFNYLSSVEGKHLPVTHCVKGTEGWAIHSKLIEVIDNFIKEELDPSFNFTNEEVVLFIEKNSFGYDHWRDELLCNPLNKNTTTIEVVGTCTDICVISNALGIKAAYPEAEVYVDSSCCAGTTKENHEAALQIMRCCHINVY